MPKLVVLTEGFKGTTHELKTERTTVGRLEDNAFHLAEPSVSSHHCEVLLQGNEVLIKDLNSTNGTFINGQQTKEGVLKPGQILRLGHVELRLENGTAPPAAAKKPLEHTVPMPGGVKLNELEQGGARVVSSPFAKKSNKANKIFLYVGLGVGLVIIVLLVMAITQLKSIK